MRILRTILLGTALALTGAASHGASIRPAQVDGLAIDCLFNSDCNAFAEENSSSLALPGTVGTGLLITRVIQGEPDTPAAGLFGYEYRIDLSGVTLDPVTEPCVTNLVQCRTNRIQVSLTNLVVCRTNMVGAMNRLNCVTNLIPATNMVFCFTNSFLATNIVQCFTGPAGVMTCFTNRFPATNHVVCFTNRVPARAIVSCQTNRFPGTAVAVCTTNNVRYSTNLVTCTTNLVPCPDSTPCIDTMEIRFGPAVAMDFDTNGTLRDLVYVIHTNGLGTVVPSEIIWDDGRLVLRFSPPLCPGDASVSVGLVSHGAPRDLAARLKLSTDETALAIARAPQVVRRIDCGVDELTTAIRKLRTQDIIAPNNAERHNRYTALLDLALAAEQAAEAGQADDVIDALAAIFDKTDGGRNDWLSAATARKVNRILADIAECLADDGDNGDDGDGKDRDDKEDKQDKKDKKDKDGKKDKDDGRQSGRK